MLADCGKLTERQIMGKTSCDHVHIVRAPSRSSEMTENRLNLRGLVDVQVCCRGLRSGESKCSQ